jgi:hypothetical protein
MLFKNEILAGIVRGDITLAFRRWKRAAPKPGSTLITQCGVLSIDTVEAITVADISERDAKRAGAASRQALLASLTGEGQLLRMKVRIVGEDPRLALREQRADLQALPAHAQQFLQLIADHEGVVSTQLSAQLGMDNAAFKRKVRQLKAHGLTESLEVGYRLSKSGRDALKRLKASRG